MLIGVGYLVPGANVVMGAVALAALGIVAGRAIYNWWKGPKVVPPVIDIPASPEQIGPVTHVAYDDPPPGPPPSGEQYAHPKDPTVPTSLRMRSDGRPADKQDMSIKPSLSITKGYDPVTGQSR
jgi:hypothetical protein